MVVSSLAARGKTVPTLACFGIVNFVAFFPMGISWNLAKMQNETKIPRDMSKPFSICNNYDDIFYYYERGASFPHGQ